MTTTLRPLFGIVLAAFVALSLITTTIDAVASTPALTGGSAQFDKGFVNGTTLLKPRPIGRLGVTWE